MTDPGEGVQPPHPAPPVPPAFPVPPYSAAGEAGQFAAPSVPPYTAPPYAAPPYAAPPYAAPQYAAPQQPAAPNPTYPGAPQYVAPPAPYTGYAQPGQAYGPYVPQPQSPAPLSNARGLGVIAFLLALVAAVVAPLVGAIAAFNVGAGIDPNGLSSIEQPDASFDWSVLTPVREWVLLGEVSFWAGTVLGVWALVQAIVAIARKRGRGWAVAAVVLAVMGAVIFSVALTVAGFAGLATSAVALG